MRPRPLLRCVGKLTETPSRITPGDADAVFAAGWNERALHDAVSICGLFSLMNRIVEGSGSPPAVTYFALSSRRLVDNGYSGLRDML